MSYMGKIKSKGEKLALVACASGVVIAAVSCAQKGSQAIHDTAFQEEIPFHADNDIAMTVRSIVDAVRVGESLSPEDYDFEGILTDGQGTPLYTDVDGSPGEWTVKVENDSVATISNRHIGDLMDDDLLAYILGALNLNSADLVSAYENPLRENEMIYHFDSGDVDLKFSTIPMISESGFEGSLMTIRILKKAVNQ